MNSTPPNMIPINEWVDHFDYFIHPMQPGEFNIQPILRARYGNLLKDGIISIRLFAEYRTVILIVTESGNTENVVIDFTRTQIKNSQTGNIQRLDELFFRDVPDAPDLNAPQEERRAWFNRMLSSLLWLFDSNETASHLCIFTPHYLALLERIQDNNNFQDELIYTEERLESAISFYGDCIQVLAQPIRNKAVENLVSVLVKKLKTQGATGIFNDALTSYWDEICVFAADQGNDNVLYESLCNTLDSDIYYEIKSLSEAEQFALWYFGDEVDGNLKRWFSGGDYVEDVISLKKDFSMPAKDIRDELLGTAMNSLSPKAREFLGY